MPKIEDELGTKAGLGEQTDPLSATPQDGEAENPLEKLDEISKAKPQKEKGGSKKLDEKTVEEMLKTGENTSGLFEPKEKEEHEEEDDSAKVKVGSSAQPSEKYEKAFKDDMLKHPNEYKVMTPRGEMTVAEALRAGYNPITKRFDRKHGQEQLKEKYLSQLNEADRQAIEGLTDPSAAQVAPADAEKYGLPANSPMIRGMGGQQPTPDMSGLMPGMGPEPQLGASMPGSETESMAPGATDISALLGGQNGGNQ